MQQIYMRTPMPNAPQKRSEEFACKSKFDVEHMMFNPYYWFHKCTKRKNSLFFFCIFCDQDLCKHINTRWITLELAVEQTLFQYESLKSYFLSENYAHDRFKRLRHLFGDPLTEVYLLFSKRC